VKYKVLNYLRNYIYVFYSRAFYKDVATKWTGIGFVFLMNLVVICVIFSLYKPYKDMTSELKGTLVAEFPTVTITKGIISIDKKSPYFIRVKETNEILVIFDISGKYNTVDATNADVLVTKTNVQVARVDSNPYKIASNKLGNIVIGKRTVSIIVTLISMVMSTLLGIAILVIGLLVIYLKALFLSLIGMVIVKVRSAPLNYMSLFRLTVVSIAPGVVAFTLLLNADIWVYKWGIILILNLGYLYFAIDSSMNRGSK